MNRERSPFTGRIFAPKVTDIHGDHLICDNSLTQAKIANNATLLDFLELADAPTGDILTYAKRWGALNIRAGELPDSQFLERIQDWRDRSQRFRAIKNIGAALNNRSKGSAADWTLLGINPTGLDTITDAR